MQTVRTIYSAHLATTKALGRPFTVLENSTLNQKFNVYPEETPLTGQYPVVGYIAIGNRGVNYEMTSDNFLLTQEIPHSPRDASLYSHIPFVARKLTDTGTGTFGDLPPAERSKYRMRKVETIDGIKYAFYYLRIINLNDVIPEIEIRNVNEGIVTINSFRPSISDLSPERTFVSNVDLNNPSGDYLVSTAKLSLTLDQTDIHEIMTACEILFGDSRYSVISEIAVCSGVDRILEGDVGSGATDSYIETVATQINAFIYQFHALTQSTTEVNLRIDVGSSEPLLF